MAKYRRGKKIQPAVMTLAFATPGTSGGNFTIDLSQCASLVNRRFYRQGINWVVESIRFQSLQAGKVQIAKIPTTWTFFNAYKKGFEAYREMTERALEDTESVRPRFEDFKIYADAIHHNAGFGNNLLPIDSAGTAAGAGEWESSKISVPNTASPGTANEYELLAVGANYPGAGASGNNAVSLIEGYAASRGLPYQEDPNVPADAADVSGTSAPANWIGALNNEGVRQNEQVLDNLLDENNKAPYPFEGDGTAVDTQYPGGANQMPNLALHDQIQLFASSPGQIGTRSSKGGIFPAGLMRIVWDPEASANLVMLVNLVPGHHRGYMCEPTLEA